jgi:hypothetical protein
MNIYFEELLEFLNNVFAVIFNIEMLLKLSSDGHRYFLNNWNLFDMFIVISADLGIILEFYQLSGNFKSVSTVFRALRILRIAKLLKEFENIRVILDSVAVILPNITNVMCLFVLILYIYACIGIYLFAGAMRLEELNRYNNFTTFGRAMLGLTRYSTGEDFQEFMYEFSNTGNGCKVSNYLLLYFLGHTNIQRYPRSKWGVHGMRKLFGHSLLYVILGDSWMACS